ncbi:MAG: LysR family transcriptional regulator [Chloroflexota bacterium]
MELRVLRYLLAIVDHGSMNRAASAIGVAQPSLSRQIRGLELDLGLELFTRESGRMRLTAAGHRFVPMARELVARADAARDLMHGLADGSGIRLALVAPETTVADVIAPFLATQGRDDPTILAREALPADVFAEVLAGRADVGISSGPPPAELESRSVGQFPVYAYVPAGHPLARGTSIDVKKLGSFPLILLETGHGTRRLFDVTMAAEGLGYQLAFEAPVPQVAQALAASGRGVAIVTDDPRYGLRPLRILVHGTELRIPLVGAWAADHYASGIIADWLQNLAAFASDRPVARHAGEARSRP